MKTENSTWTFDERANLVAPNGKRFEFFPISPAAIENKSPGAKAKTARERAIVFLRMLRGAHIWDDGYERKIDDCFEMYDGDEVVCFIVAIAEAIPVAGAPSRNITLLINSSFDGSEASCWISAIESTLPSTIPARN